MFQRIIIQPDWFLNLKSNILPANVWLEYKEGSSNMSTNAQKRHGQCTIKSMVGSDESLVDVSCSESFHSGCIDRQQLVLEIKVDGNDLFNTFQGPMSSFKTTAENIHQQETKTTRSSKTSSSIHSHCFDISSGGVGLTGLSNGTITIWDINNGQIRRQIKGHTEDVYISRFFPSDFALVSGGADMRVRIHSLDSENDKIREGTLIGHHSRINDVFPIDPKHVLSASNDGSAILWDIEKSEQVHKIAQISQNSINAISLIDSSIVACAFQDGFIRFYQLNGNKTNQVIHQIEMNSSVTGLCHLSESKQIVCGNEQSNIGVFDLRKLNNEPIRLWKEQRGKINNIIPSFDRRGILTTSADGSCFEYDQKQFENIINSSSFSVIDYTGADDSVLNGKIFNNNIYSLCRDNFIRVYNKQNRN